MTTNDRMRIFLTGVDGQVGHELLRSLQGLGEVIFSTMAPWKDLTGRESVVVDMTRPEMIRSVIRDVRPHLIVNPAAYTAVDKAESETATAQAVNAAAPGVLAEEAKKLGASLIHYSTDYVYDGGGTKPWREDSPTGPLGAYGRTKLAGEQAITASGVPHIILRTCWVYGIFGNNFVKTMLRLGRDREELKVVGDQIGAPTSARMLADVTSQLVAQAARQRLPQYFGQYGGVYHLCCSGETSWHGFAMEIFRMARELGVPLKVRDVKQISAVEFPTPAKRPANSRLDLSKLRANFGIMPPDWRVALAQSLPALWRDMA